MAVTIRRMKTMLCRSNSKISLVFFNGTTIQTNFCCVLIFRQMMGKHQIFYFPFRENSFISKKWSCSAHVTSAFRMFLCATQMTTSISQSRKIKIISAHERKAIQFLIIARSACFGSQQNLQELLVHIPWLSFKLCATNCWSLKRYLSELQPAVKKGMSHSGSRVAATAPRPTQSTSHIREEQASAYIAYSTQDTHLPSHYITV